jgi:hypothetical protein
MTSHRLDIVRAAPDIGLSDLETVGPQLWQDTSFTAPRRATERLRRARPRSEAVERSRASANRDVTDRRRRRTLALSFNELRHFVSRVLAELDEQLPLRTGRRCAWRRLGVMELGDTPPPASGPSSRLRLQTSPLHARTDRDLGRASRSSCAHANRCSHAAVIRVAVSSVREAIVPARPY